MENEVKQILYTVVTGVCVCLGTVVLYISIAAREKKCELQLAASFITRLFLPLILFVIPKGGDAVDRVFANGDFPSEARDLALATK